MRFHLAYHSFCHPSITEFQVLKRTLILLFTFKLAPFSTASPHAYSLAKTRIDDDANDIAASILLCLYPSTALVAVRGLLQRATSLVPCTRATMISCIQQRNLLHCQRYCRRSLSQISNKRCSRRHHPANVMRSFFSFLVLLFVFSFFFFLNPSKRIERRPIPNEINDDGR